MQIDMQNLKKQLRAHYKNLRVNQNPNQLLAQTDAIISRTHELIKSNSFCKKQIRVAGYSPIGNELDCLKLLAVLEDHFRNVDKIDIEFFLPLILDFEASKMAFFPYKPSEPHESQNLVMSKFGLEPKGSSLELTTSLDLVLVPLVAFDDNLNRLGYGKGFYDRFFNANHTPLKIGLAFEFQKLPESAKDIFLDDKFNVPLDFIVSESKIYGKQVKPN